MNRGRKGIRETGKDWKGGQHEGAEKEREHNSTKRYRIQNQNEKK